MKIIFFSSNMDIIDEWKQAHDVKTSEFCYDFRSLKEKIEEFKEHVLIVDYDTVAHELNKLIFSAQLPENVIVLERVPEIITGKMLVTRGIKAYGNSRMMPIHFKQMLKTVQNTQVWTYPELTAAMAKKTASSLLSDEATELIVNRLTNKESETTYLVLEGLTNDAIAHKLGITTRTVKAHVSSVFSKLHVNDRVSLILLLR